MAKTKKKISDVFNLSASSSKKRVRPWQKGEEKKDPLPDNEAVAQKQSIADVLGKPAPKKKPTSEKKRNWAKKGLQFLAKAPKKLKQASAESMTRLGTANHTLYRKSKGIFQSVRAKAHWSHNNGEVKTATETKPRKLRERTS